MKKLRNGNTVEKAAYMRMRQKENLILCRKSKAEKWAYEILKEKSGYKWSRQAIWGFRLFDFWNHELGCAIEIDGPEHRKDYDLYRDKYNYLRSAIVVLRVKNFNSDDMNKALESLKKLRPWMERRALKGLLTNKQKIKLGINEHKVNFS